MGCHNLPISKTGNFEDSIFLGNRRSPRQSTPYSPFGIVINIAIRPLFAYSLNVLLPYSTPKNALFTIAKAVVPFVLKLVPTVLYPRLDTTLGLPYQHIKRRSHYENYVTKACRIQGIYNRSWHISSRFDALFHNQFLWRDAGANTKQNLQTCTNKTT